MTLCGELVVHGAAAQRLALGLLPYSGTLMPSDGMEKVWPTPLPGVGVDDPERLAVQGRHVAVRPGYLAELLVAQWAAGVVLDDRDVDADVLGHLEHRGVDPLALRATRRGTRPRSGGCPTRRPPPSAG